MTTAPVLRRTLPVLLLLALGAGHAAPTDQNLAALDVAARAQGESFAQRVRTLNERIVRGWPQGSVRALMGDPERVQVSVDGRDQIEVWGYAGFDVRVQFRNGFVESWFVRFAQ